jgi:hypothetical protein
MIPRRYALYLMIMITLSASFSSCQEFILSGYENLTGPGPAHLMLNISGYDQQSSNHTLRVEISGPIAGSLSFKDIQTETDLGYFQLNSGNYTFDFYVLKDHRETVELSGEVVAEGRTEFSIPEPPEPPPEDEPILDPTNLGFMVVGLLTFGLVLVILRTTEREHVESDEQ